MWQEMKWTDNLHDMGFRPCSSKADPDLVVWMRRSNGGNYYEYIVVLVDDLIFLSHYQTPELIIDSIMDIFNNKDLKGVGGESEYLLLLRTPLGDDAPPPVITPSPPIPPEPPPNAILFSYSELSAKRLPSKSLIKLMISSFFCTLRRPSRSFTSDNMIHIFVMVWPGDSIYCVGCKLILFFLAIMIFALSQPGKSL